MFLKNLFGKSLGYTRLRMVKFGEQPAFALNALAGKTVAKMGNYPISGYT
jgi:hypothetical protein